MHIDRDTNLSYRCLTSRLLEYFGFDMNHSIATSVGIEMGLE